MLPLDDDGQLNTNSLKNQGTTYDDENRRWDDHQDTGEPRNKTQFNENVTSSSSSGRSEYSYDLEEEEDGEAE